MDWYGIEPLVPADPAKALHLAATAPMPLDPAIHRATSRRRCDRSAKTKAISAPLVAVLAAANEKAQLDLLKGAARGTSRAART